MGSRRSSLCRVPVSAPLNSEFNWVALFLSFLEENLPDLPYRPPSSPLSWSVYAEYSREGALRMRTSTRQFDNKYRRRPQRSALSAVVILLDLHLFKLWSPVFRSVATWSDLAQTTRRSTQALTKISSLRTSPCRPTYFTVIKEPEVNAPRSV